MKHVLLLGIFACLVAVSCAKKRPVERVPDPDSSRWAKGAFEDGKNWLYKVTIVKNGANSAFGFVGLQSEMRLGRFRFTETKLEFLSTTDIYGTDQTTEKVVNSWSGTHSDYHQAEVGGRVSNVETENNEISWKDKNFFVVDWTNATVSERDSFGYGTYSPCFTKTASRVVDDSEEITPEHITFTVAVDYKFESQKCLDQTAFFNQENSVTLHYKYSFIPDPVDSTYQPYVYTGEIDPLMKKYGYFNSFVARVGADNRQTNTFLMNRWDPEKTHTFYFTENFPEEYKWIYNDPESGIMARTNQLFELNKIKTRFEIKDNTGQKFGDLRYSFINFITEPERSAPLGYGPSDAHPLTGEIIAANSMMWTSALKPYVQLYRDEAAISKTQYDTSSIYRNMSSVLGLGPIDWTASARFLENPDFGFFYRYLLPEFTYGRQGNGYTFQDNPYENLFKNEKLMTVASKLNFQQEMQTSIYSKDETIRKQLDYYAQSNKLAGNETTVYYLEDAMTASGGFQSLPTDISDQSIIDDILYRTAIHEFGHNLNLRHNFYGSVDAQINRRPGEDLSKKLTTSVMDYLALSDEIGLDRDWAVYDNAALAFAYSSGEVDLANNVNYNYLYCTDEHRTWNPLCNAFDQGSTPTEVVANMIKRYDSSYARNNFRYDRAFWDTRSYEGRAFGTMFDIKKIVKLYQETFTLSQVENELANVALINATVTNTITNAIRSDITEATKLAAAFYYSVITQTSLERPFTDSYDDFTGQVQRLGIYLDKWWAQRFLLGDDSFPLDPNNGQIPVSFISLRDDPQVGPVIDKILLDIFVKSGDAYVGFDDFGRLLYANNAARYFDFEGSQGAIDLMKVECFSPTSFQAAFNTDPDGLPSSASKFTPNFAGATAADPYFRDKGEIVTLKINSDIYVASTGSNKYSAGLMEANDLNGVLNMHFIYKNFTTNEVSRCL